MDSDNNRERMEYRKTGAPQPFVNQFNCGMLGIVQGGLGQEMTGDHVISGHPSYSFPFYALQGLEESFKITQCTLGRSATLYSGSF